jgi:imidazolonepropionase-like amidohydrolase
VAGQSALMMLDGWTYEDMTLRAPVGLHVNWPAMAPVTPAELDETRRQQLEQRDKQLAALKKVVADARAYVRGKRAKALAGHDLRHEALALALEPDAQGNQLPVFIRADEWTQIEAAVAWTQQEGLKMVLVGGYDALRCEPLLKKHDIPVVVQGVHRLPLRKGDPYDEPFTLAERLREAGVKFCICDGGRFAASGTRNLPYHAGTAAAHGLPPDEALRAITLYPAQILRAADRVGSLEPGKDATLFVAGGDILETPTQVERVWVQGRAVDLSSRHTRLHEKYREKYRRQRPTVP